MFKFNIIATPINYLSRHLKVFLRIGPTNREILLIFTEETALSPYMGTQLINFSFLAKSVPPHPHQQMKQTTGVLLEARPNFHSVSSKPAVWCGFPVGKFERLSTAIIAFHVGWPRLKNTWSKQKNWSLCFVFLYTNSCPTIIMQCSVNIP